MQWTVTWWGNDNGDDLGAPDGVLLGKFSSGSWIGKVDGVLVRVFLNGSRFGGLDIFLWGNSDRR